VVRSTVRLTNKLKEDWQHFISVLNFCSCCLFLFFLFFIYVLSECSLFLFLLCVLYFIFLFYVLYSCSCFTFFIRVLVLDNKLLAAIDTSDSAGGTPEANHPSR